MNKLIKILGIMAVTLAMMIGTASQATTAIGINFAGGSGGEGGDPSHPLAPGDVTGVVPQGFWNNAVTAGGAAGALLDSTGAPTGASVTWASAGTWSDSVHFAFPTPAGALMDNYLDAGSGAPASVTLAGIPYVDYSVYVYIKAAERPDEQPGGFTPLSDYAISGALAGNGTISAQRNSDTEGDAFILATPASIGSYILFPKVSGPTFTLTANAAAANFRSPIDGIQIVQQVPEPSTFMLIAFGLVGLFGAIRWLRRP